MSAIRFDGRVAVVTGSGNGLGMEYALELARRGAKVVVNDLGGSATGVGKSTNAADQVVERIRDEGGEAVANYDSVSTREGGSAIVETALAHFGKLDICICNAGFLRNNRFEDLSDQDIDSILDVHLKSAFYVGQPAYKAMRKNGYGRILFTGSASAMYGHAWQANYAAAKAGLVGVSNVVAIEGSAYGITSNVLMPVALSRMADVMDAGFMEIPSFAESVRNVDYSASDGRMGTSFTTPMALYLVSEACTATHGIFSSISGRYAQVRIVAGDGWVAPMDANPSIEDVAAHFEQISARDVFHEPLTMYEEFNAVVAAARRQGVI